MAEYIEALQRLAEAFGRLDGVGKKSAMRMAFSVIDMPDQAARELALSINEARDRIHLCPVCQNITDREMCLICSDEGRDRSTICVVEDSRAVMAMEKVREYNGMYHVLGGVISPMNGITPDKLRIKELLARIDGGEVSEVIIATNPTIEGDATAMYLSRLLKPLGIVVSRLAYGVSVGSDIVYADAVTLDRALEGRRKI